MATDQDAARVQYKSGLADLTFNSRPIIMTLTMIASENLGSAPGIVKAIQEQIESLPPAKKLPVIYLMDSILKNVGGVYCTLFSGSVSGIFKGAFDAMSKDDRNRLSKLIPTWRKPPGNKPPLFPTHILQDLERFVMSRDQMSAAPKFMPTVSLPTSVPQQQRPLVSQQEFPPKFAPAPAFEFPPKPQPVYAPPPQQPAAQVALVQQQIQSLLSQKQAMALLNPRDLANANQINVLSQLLQLVRTTALDPMTMSQISAQIASMMYTPSVPGMGPPHSIHPSQPPQFRPIVGMTHAAPPPTQELTRVDQLPILKLSTLDVNKPLPGAVNILYGAIGLQCRQCGLRFPKTDPGKSKMEEHMDWHFRANRRAKDTTKRMVSREWYLDVDPWIAENEESEQTVPDIAVETKPEEPVEINIPAETSESVKCQVCLEIIDKFYDESTDEWMLRNAMKEKDSYYHRPCLANRKQARLSRAASPIPPSSSLKKRKEDSDADEESIKKVKTEESLINEESSADEMSWDEPDKISGAASNETR